MKTVAVSENIWRKPRKLKEKMGFQSYSELVSALVEKRGSNAVREEMSKINVGFSCREAGDFVDVVKRRETPSPTAEVKHLGGGKPDSR